MYRKIELNNRLRVVLNHMPGMESAAIGVWVATGSRNEGKKLCGASHFLEHMLFKGTPSKNSRQIKEEIEGRGGSLNGFTSEELTCYLAKVSSRHIGKALEILSDMVLHASIDESDMEKERPVIIEEIKMYRDLPNHYVHDILSELLWPGHSLGLPVAGNIETVSAITRQDLLGYKKRLYIPENIVLVLCGKVDDESIVKRTSKIFRLHPKEKPAHIARFTDMQSSPRIKVLQKKTEQSHLAMGVHTFGRLHRDRYTLSLLHIIMGANMSSRLFENVREKRGLAYEIGTELKRYKDTGAFCVHAGIEHKKVKDAISLIIKELKKIKQAPVPEKELKRAKEYFKVQLLIALEGTMEHMLWLGEQVISSGKLPDKDDIIKKIDAVKSGDIQRVAGAIFSAKNINLALIGNVQDTEKREIALELSAL